MEENVQSKVKASKSPISIDFWIRVQYLPNSKFPAPYFGFCGPSPGLLSNSFPVNLVHIDRSINHDGRSRHFNCSFSFKGRENEANSA